MIDFKTYLKEIEKAFQSDLATEHTYRPFLKSFIESFDKDITAINEPKRRTFGAPDYIIRKREIPLGYIEAKDVGKDLDKLDKREKEQLKKYLDSLNNIIYTNYLDFRWYVRGEVVSTITLAEFDAVGKLQPKADAEKQLTNLIKEFLQEHIPTVATPKELAKRMASITRLIRQTIEKALEDETTSKENTLHEQFESFKKTLLPNLDEKGFADLYSQTIAYGLFTACCFDKKPPFTRQKAAYLVPKTNPFLRDTFDRIAGIHLDERIVWAVDDLAELLNRTNISAILQDFGKRTRQEDPVVHFYETFLAEYDPKLRETRGVYYTPEPVVSYIVRSIDKILQTDFGLPKGLADSSKLEDGSHRVLILDPATGTGTFLYNVIKNIFKRYERNKGMWDGYVSEHLLPRIFGFELLVAPYAVAHLKLGLLLEETGYKFATNERLRIYLNNTLDFVALKEEKPDAFSAFINKEASAARETQQDKPVMIILGNPPYEEESTNNGLWITKLMRGSDSLNTKSTDNYFEVDNKPIGEKNPKSLNNDYVKFIRFAQWRIEQTGYGVLAFITPNTYQINPTFRGMRESLVKTFDKIYILNLHGYYKENCPDGSKDENVFDIKQGVTISIFIKRNNENSNSTASKKFAEVFHKDLFGLREISTENTNDNKQLEGGKYHWLLQNDISTSEWEEIKPNKPFYLFIPQDETLRSEYELCWKITEVMPLNNVGIVTSRDKLVSNSNKVELKAKIDGFADLQKSDSEIKNKYLSPRDSLNLSKARKAIINDKAKLATFFIKFLYRPFEVRHLFYHDAVIERSRSEVMQHLLFGNNLALITNRQVRLKTIQHFFATHFPTDYHILETANASAYIFPLYVYPIEKRGLFDKESSARKPNFSDEFIKDFSAKLKLEFVSDGKGDLEKTFAPEDIFNYAYAVFHSPTYRVRYAEFLKIDFPRLPLTSNPNLFRRLVGLGSQLVELHLLEKDIESAVTFPEKGSNEVEFVKYEDGRVWINKTQYFDFVPESVWNFHIGGYQVLQKWLKDRKGRTLTFDDLEHYSKIVAALNVTIEIMNVIDETIEENSGFPIE